MSQSVAPLAILGRWDQAATLASALETVEAEHLQPLGPAVKAINAQFDVIVSALPGIAAKAAVVAERRPQ